LLKQHPDALKAIISLSPKFMKLHNPVLRKVIAGRTSIAMASRLGGCSVDDFFAVLQPLGFVIGKGTSKIEVDIRNRTVPEFMKSISANKIVELDVRPSIESGEDPLDIIIQKVSTLKAGFVLKIINSFEPTPLILLLGKQGFESYVEMVSDELVNTFFYKGTDKIISPDIKDGEHEKGWDEVIEHFNGNLETIDVRELEMPLPMHSILEALQSLPAGKALLVYHKRIPVFLLPELEEQLFSYRIKEISDSQVNLLIYKKGNAS